MKKSRFLVLVLVVSIMMMGAGYAYWTDAVTLTTTVNTGNLEVLFDTAGTTNNVRTFAVTPVNGQNAVATGTVTFTDDRNASIAVANLFPGASGSTSLSVINNSTIPVKLVDMGFTPTTTGINTSEVIVSATISSASLAQPITVPNVLNLTANQVNAINGAIIPAGADCTITFNFSMPFGTTETGSENGSYSFNVSPEFRQFNDNR